MKLGYARVSSEGQNLSRQIEALENAGCEKIFTEKQSGKNLTDRPVLNQLLEVGLREGDTLVILDFSRLARNTKDLLMIAETVRDRKANLVSLKEGLDLSTDMGKLVLTILGSIYEFERTSINERQRQGIEIAKREGKYQGGQRKKIDETVFTALYEKYQSKEINKVQFAESLQVSRPTLDKLLKEREAC